MFVNLGLIGGFVVRKVIIFNLFGLSLGLALVLLGVGSSAKAYTPYTQKAEPSFQFNPVSLQQPLSTRTIRLNQADLHFEKSLADRMMTIEQGPSAWTSFGQSKLFECQDVRTQLGRLEGINAGLANSVKGNVLRSCQLAENPEMLFVKGKVVEPSFFGFSDVSSMAELLLTGLQLQSLPLTFGGGSEAKALQGALFKLGYSKIKSQWSASQKSIESALSKVGGGSAEAQSLRELLQSHQILFGRLMEFNAESKRQYVLDHQKVIEQGRRRDSLPYDNLTDRDRRVLTTYLSAGFWRLRGGGLVDKPSGTQATRYHYTQVVMNLLADLNGGAGAPRHGDDHFQNLIFKKGWGVWMDMGRTPGQASEAHDLFYMTQRGVDQVDGIIERTALARFDSDPILVSGLQMGICYLFSWERLGHLKLTESAKAPFAPFMDGPTAWGEWCVGAALGHGVSESLLKGR